MLTRFLRNSEKNWKMSGTDREKSAGFDREVTLGAIHPTGDATRVFSTARHVVRWVVASCLSERWVAHGRNIHNWLGSQRL